MTSHRGGFEYYVLGISAKTNSIRWELLPDFASLEETRGQLHHAHRLKLQEAQLAVHDDATWNEVIRLWRKAAEADLRDIGEPATTDDAIRAARIHRLLLRPAEGIRLLQRSLSGASERCRGELLIELARCFAAQNRYDLAAYCHEEADDLLRDSPTYLDHMLAWAVALTYLQRFEEARRLLSRVLICDANRAAARAALEKLDLPPVLRQACQLIELSCHGWQEVLQKLRC